MLVGARLRRLRTQRGITRERAGAAIRASEWKIHRLENGQVSFKERDIVDLLCLYGVTDPGEIVAFLNVAQETNTPGWWHQYGDVLPHWLRPYVDLESAATLIRVYESHFVPGLLQTEDYMRAWMRALGHNPLDDIERRVAMRVARQALLTRPDAAHLWAVIDEAALRRSVGGPGVMRGQLKRLIEATTLPNVTLQVLPFGAGAHPARTGAFSILRFAGSELPDVVYVEQLTNALYLDKRDDVCQYLRVMAAICVRSANPGKTEEILNRIMREGEGCEARQVVGSG
jgi:hypothetical protein